MPELAQIGISAFCIGLSAGVGLFCLKLALMPVPQTSQLLAESATITLSTDTEGLI